MEYLLVMSLSDPGYIAQISDERRDSRGNAVSPAQDRCPVLPDTAAVSQKVVSGYFGEFQWIQTHRRWGYQYIWMQAVSYRVCRWFCIYK